MKMLARTQYNSVLGLHICEHFLKSNKQNI